MRFGDEVFALADADGRLWLGSNRGLLVVPEAELLDRSDVTLKVEINRVPVDFVSYPYSPSAPPSVGPEGIAKLAQLVLEASVLPKVRRKTKPSRGSIERRLTRSRPQ